MDNDIKTAFDRTGIKYVILDEVRDWCDDLETYDDDGNCVCKPQGWHLTGIAVPASEYARAIAVVGTLWDGFDSTDYEYTLGKWRTYVGDDDMLPIDVTVRHCTDGEDDDREMSIEGSGRYYVGTVA